MMRGIKVSTSSPKYPNVAKMTKANEYISYVYGNLKKSLLAVNIISHYYSIWINVKAYIIPLLLYTITIGIYRSVFVYIMIVST